MAETNEPPPYDPEADDADEENATASEQETKPKKEKVPDEPPPDGEGELGSPMTRVYFIGGGLALWGILGFWLAVYWLASAIDPCRYWYRTYACYAVSQQDDCIDEGYSACEAFYKQDLGSSGSSSTSGTTPSPTFNFNFRRRNLLITNNWGNWETDTDLPEFSGWSVDISTVSNGREAWNEQYADDYVASSWAIRMVAWLVLTLGIGIGFFGAIASYFAVKKGNGCYNKMAYIMVGIGGAFTAIGGVLFIASFDYDIYDGNTLEDFYNAIRATQLGEFLLVGVIGIIFAMDLQQLLLNDEEKRMMAMTVPVAILSLFLGGCYAYIINWNPDGSTCYDFLLYDQMATISAGYFIIGIMCVLRILIAKETIKLGDDPARATLYQFAIAIILIIGGFVCAVGYWAVIDKTFDNDTECFVCDGSSNCYAAYHYVAILQFLYQDTYQPQVLTGTAGGGESYDVKYESQFKAFYCGYSFLIFAWVAAIAYDMNLIGNYKKVRAAQSAASDE